MQYEFLHRHFNVNRQAWITWQHFHKCNSNKSLNTFTWYGTCTNSWANLFTSFCLLQNENNSSNSTGNYTTTTNNTNNISNSNKNTITNCMSNNGNSICSNIKNSNGISNKTNKKNIIASSVSIFNDATINNYNAISNNNNILMTLCN